MKHEKGDSVLVETPWGWVPGVFLSYVGSVAPEEDFIRLNVNRADGSQWPGCHPDCVKPAPQPRPPQ